MDTSLVSRLRKMAQSRSSRSSDRVEWGAADLIEEQAARIATLEAILRQIADSGDGSINAHLARTVLGDYAKGQSDAQQGD